MSPRSCTGSDRRVEYDEGSNRTSHSIGYVRPGCVHSLRHAVRRGPMSLTPDCRRSTVEEEGCRMRRRCSSIPPDHGHGQRTSPGGAAPRRVLRES